MSLGSLIKKARKDASYSIDELSQATNIRLTLLREIEADDFSHCGGDTYARGHVRNIARALKSDENEFLRFFDLEQRVAERSIQSLLIETNVMRQPKSGRRVSWKVLIAISIASLAIAGGIQIVLTNNFNSKPTTLNPAATPSPSSNASAPTSASKSPTTKPVDSFSTGIGVEVIVSAVRAKTWLFVSDASGRTLFSGEISKGVVQTYTTSTRLDLRIGNAGGVDLQVNGKAVPGIGANGAVVSVSYGVNS